MTALEEVAAVLREDIDSESAREDRDLWSKAFVFGLKRALSVVAEAQRDSGGRAVPGVYTAEQAAR